MGSGSHKQGGDDLGILSDFQCWERKFSEGSENICFERVWSPRVLLHFKPSRPAALWDEAQAVGHAGTHMFSHPAEGYLFQSPSCLASAEMRIDSYLFLC